MCDPVSIMYGVATVATIASSERSRDKAEDAAHQQYVEAGEATALAKRDATARLNAQIVADQRRRRAARGLLSLGTDEQGALGPGGARPANARSLLSLGTGAYNPASAGADVPGSYYGGGGGGGVGGGRPQVRPN